MAISYAYKQTHEHTSFYDGYGLDGIGTMSMSPACHTRKQALARDYRSDYGRELQLSKEAVAMVAAQVAKVGASAGPDMCCPATWHSMIPRWIDD